MVNATGVELRLTSLVNVPGVVSGNDSSCRSGHRGGPSTPGGGGDRQTTECVEEVKLTLDCHERGERGCRPFSGSPITPRDHRYEAR